MAYKFAGCYSGQAISALTGRPLPSVAFSVYTTSALTTLSTLYTSRTKAVATTNPNVADTYGNIVFFADPGDHWVVVNGVAVQVQVPPDPNDVFSGSRRQHDTGQTTPIVAETVERSNCSTDLSVLTTQIVQLQAIELPPLTVCTSLTYISGATAANTPTNWWFVLCDKNRVVLAVTADQTSTAWAANTAMTKAFGTPYTTPEYPDLYYVGIMVKATTPPSLRGPAAMGNSVLASTFTPTLCGASSTGQTTPPALAATLTAITPGVNFPYAAVT